MSMKYHKTSKSPEPQDGTSEPSMENQEAVMIDNGRQKKLSRNKQTASATIVGPDGQEIIEGSVHGSKEDFLDNSHPKSASKLVDSKKSPNERRRAVLPVSQPRACSPRPEIRPI